MPLIESFVKNPVKVTVGVLLVVLYGVLAARLMPMQLTPEVQIPTLSIETRWPGASPQEIEREIVQEQEEQLKSVEGVTKMTSESQDSFGTVKLEFAIGTDMSEALLKVNTKLAQVPEYPEDADEPVINTSNSSDRPIAWFILSQKPPSVEKVRAFAATHPEIKAELERAASASSSGLRMMRLRTLVKTHPVVQEVLPKELDVSTLRRFSEDFIEARFEQVNGVSNANVLGGREDEVQVVVDPHKLAARELTITDVRLALRGQNKDTSGGDFWEGKRRYVVRTLGQFRSPEQVENTILARRGGNPVYVKDVAKVVMTHKKPDGFVRRFGEHCVAVNALRAVGANVLDVMDGLRKANTEINESLLAPRDLELTQVYDETDYIYSAMNLVSENMLEGGVLTFITLLVFLKSARSTVIIFIHILVSTVGAFLIMALMGRSLNVPALGGLAFAVGMLVDNAIVMLENIFRRHQMGESPLVASVRGANEVWGALLNATIANLAVFIPILFIKEEAGQLFRDIAIAISGAVALSMLVAIAVVPTAAMRLLTPHGQVPKPSIFERWLPGPLFRAGRSVLRGLWNVTFAPLDWLGGLFVSVVVGVNQVVVRSVLLRIAVIVLFLGASVAGTWLLLPKTEYLPNGNRNLIIGILLPPPGYNLDQLDSMGQIVEDTLRPFVDVDPGSAEEKALPFPAVSDFFYVARNRQVFIGVRAVDPMQASRLIPLVNSVKDKMPGTLGFAFQSSLFEQALQSGRSIDVEISGPELSQLVQIGGQILGTVGPTFAAVTPDMVMAIPRPSLDMSNPEVHVVPKWEQAADMNVMAMELGYSVDALVDGAYATDYFLGGDKIDLRIVGDESLSSRTQDLAALPIAIPGGEVVPLAALANVSIASGPEQINHRSRQRTITIQITPPPSLPVEQAMDIIEQKILQPIRTGGQVGSEYQMTLAGTADKLRSTWQSLKWNLVLAIVITYLLMAATFESWLYPFVVIMTVPIGAVGGFAGLWVLNALLLIPAGTIQPLDVLTMLGFVMLVGTVVNNPILIVEQTLVHLEEGLPLRTAVLDSVRYRIRPIFMTTLGGLAGLLPLVLAPGAGSELYRGIGAVLLGGMLVSTVVTLVFVPALLTITVELKRGVTRLLGWNSDETAPLGAPEEIVPAERLAPEAAHGS
jgi:hydrophobic/amphiphilic exporter-1 (mainly G- bacteria), HAE1 family